MRVVGKQDKSGDVLLELQVASAKIFFKNTRKYFLCA